MKKHILFIILIFSIFYPASPAENDKEKKLTEAQKDFIIKHIGGIWTIEKRIFNNDDEISPPDVRGYLIITRDYWTQIEAQVVEKGGVKPFTGSYFGTTDFDTTHSKEMIYLRISSSYGEKGEQILNISTKEEEQKSHLVLEKDSVTQKFDGGGSVTMKNNRFKQERRNLYTTYWIRIKRPSEVF